MKGKNEGLYSEGLTTFHDNWYIASHKMWMNVDIYMSCRWKTRDITLGKPGAVQSVKAISNASDIGVHSWMWG